MREDLKVWDLKEIINALIKKAESIEEVYIFGSRSRKTNSYRSDIDLLVYTPHALVHRGVSLSAYRLPSLMHTDDLKPSGLRLKPCRNDNRKSN